MLTYLFTLVVIADGAGQCGVTRLVASDRGQGGATGDQFGAAVSRSGDRILVGAPFGEGVQRDAGAAYLFEVVSGEWSETHKFLRPLGESYDYFGFSVSIDGDRVLIGSPTSDDLGLDSGAAELYEYRNGQWELDLTLVGRDYSSAEREGFGTDVILDSDRLFVTAAGFQAGSINTDGAVYCFEHDGTTWSETQTIIGPQVAFGRSVDVDGSRMVVGSPLEDPGGSGSTGVIYVYEYDGSLWSETAVLEPPPALGRQLWMGWDVEIEGDRIVVGGPNWGVYQDSHVFVFEYNEASWDLTDTLQQGNADGGFCVAMENESIVVGSPQKLPRLQGETLFFEDHPDRGWVRTKQVHHNLVDWFGSSLHLDQASLVVGAGADDVHGAAYVYADIDHIAGTYNYGEGWPGARGVPTLYLDTNPIVGQDLSLFVGNSTYNSTFGLLFLGLVEVEVPTSLGGTILVEPFMTLPLHFVGAGPVVLTGSIPDDPALCGFSTFAQAIEVDSAASKGVSFTRGLRMDFGSA